MPGPGGFEDGVSTGCAGVPDAHVGDLARALAAAGHDVTVWTRRERPDLPYARRTEAGVMIRQVDAGPPRPGSVGAVVPHLPALAAALRTAWTAAPPAIVHAHHWTSGLASVAAARGLSVPVVQSFPTLGVVERRYAAPNEAGPRGRVPAERHLVLAVDRVVAGCTDEAAELVAMGTPRARVTVVPCGIDTAALTPDGSVHRRAEAPRLLVLGGLERPQGVEEVVAALEKVRDAELIVAGGTGADDPDLARLRACAAAIGVGHRIRFIGPAPRAAVPSLLRSVDVVVSVPWYAARPTVALAAMACGRPVVASAVGGLADALVDGVTGVLVPPRRPHETAAALRRVLASPARATAMGVAGRDRVEMRYSWARIAAETTGAYAAAVDARARSTTRTAR